MSVFRFKYFNVVNERSAMKVNTDGVLLGAAMTILPTDRRLLDIGTGTGAIALMAAQRGLGVPGQAGDDEARTGHDVMIDAIDVDEPSASEAAANFAVSPWSEHLRAHNVSLQDFVSKVSCKYDLIFSNPPYFEDSCIAPDQRKSTARHTSVGLSYREIFEFASERLTQDGRVSLVLPADQESALCRYARMCGLHLFRIMRIRTVERKTPMRIITEFSRHRCESPAEEMMTIISSSANEGKYTQEYLSLTKDFYLFA